MAGVQAVCILLDIKPSRTKDEAGQAVVDFWKPSVALMNERDFLGRLRGYDKDAIPPRVIEVRHGLCRALPAVRVKKIGRNEESPVGMGASMREGGAAQAIRSRYLSIDTFTPDNARKASPAAEGMCKWVHAMSSYDKARPSMLAVDAGRPALAALAMHMRARTVSMDTGTR